MRQWFTPYYTRIVSETNVNKTKKCTWQKVKQYVFVQFCFAASAERFSASAPPSRKHIVSDEWAAKQCLICLFLLLRTLFFLSRFFFISACLKTWNLGGSAKFFEWYLFVLHCQQRPHYSFRLLVLFLCFSARLDAPIVLCAVCVIWRQLCSWVPLPGCSHIQA